MSPDSIDAFRDRRDAGRQLAQALTHLKGVPETLVLALPRGGVPVAYEIARALGADLDVFVVRKLGVPGHEELAMGAIAPGGTRVMNHDVLEGLGITDEAVESVAKREGLELDRRMRAYRGAHAMDRIEERTVVLVDDGLATGSTMRAAIRGVRSHDPRKLVVAVPVAAPEVCAQLREEADEIVCLATPQRLYGVGAWYEDFSQLSDKDVRALLERSAA